MKTCCALLQVLLACLSCGCAATQQRVDTTVERFRFAPETEPYFQSAAGYAVFPTIGKAGAGIGGAHGKGAVYRGGAKVGEVELNQLSAGFQLGGQTFSEILFFEDERALREFCSGNFELEASASAVALAIGASASLGTAGANASRSLDQEAELASSYYKGMAIFTIAKSGIMYEVSLAGQVFSGDCQL
ncbi:MAG: YSC84-related protein [Pseudomonadota bacterium]